MTAIVVFSVAVGAVGPSSADAHPAAVRDPREERDKVRQEQADLAASVDVLKADQATVEQAMRDLEANVEGKQTEVDTAQAEVEQAEKQANEADAQVMLSEAEVAGLRDELRTVAVEAYMAPEGGAQAFALGAESLNDASQRKSLYDLKAVDTDDVIERVQAARSLLETAREDARATARDAQARKDEAGRQLDELKAAQQQQQEFAGQVESRIDASVARSLELAATDADLSNQIAMEEAALANRLREAELAKQREEEARRKAEEEAAKPPPPPTTPPPSDPGVSTPIGTSGGIPLCKAGGFTVNCRIGQAVADLVIAAKGDGVVLTGWGYRDPARQIELRRQHCGTSNYAIFDMPASQCNPPTAKPGQSMHEIGLAIDFESCPSSSSCFKWLKGNASRFGLKNLPSESWHWSPNGR
jgi:septal ring factor EnvC (AmiA/AmiB activator)